MKLEAKDVSPNIKCTQAAKRAEKCCLFVPGDLDLWHLTLIFKLVRARDQTKDVLSVDLAQIHGSRDISYTDKKHRLTSPKNRTFRSSLRVVITCYISDHWISALLMWTAQDCGMYVCLKWAGNVTAVAVICRWLRVQVESGVMMYLVERRRARSLARL